MHLLLIFCRLLLINLRPICLGRFSDFNSDLHSGTSPGRCSDFWTSNISLANELSSMLITWCKNSNFLLEISISRDTAPVSHRSAACGVVLGTEKILWRRRCWISSWDWISSSDISVYISEFVKSDQTTSNLHSKFLYYWAELINWGNYPAFPVIYGCLHTVCNSMRGDNFTKVFLICFPLEFFSHNWKGVSFEGILNCSDLIVFSTDQIQWPVINSQEVSIHDRFHYVISILYLIHSSSWYKRGFSLIFPP